MPSPAMLTGCDGSPNVLTAQAVHDRLEEYAVAVQAAGLPAEWFRRSAAAGAFLTEKQLLASAAARLADLPDGPLEIGYGGQRGGGKSHWALFQLGVDDAQRQPGLRALWLRRLGVAGKESLENLRHQVLRNQPHRYQTKGRINFPNNSWILAGHYKDEKDIDRYLGLEYDVIAIEEATTLTERKYQMIRTACRTSKPGWRPRLYTTTNPGGVGHGWYKNRFIKPYRAKEETDTRFIPAGVADNPHLNPEYKAKVLERLTGWLRRAWLEGDWDILAGQFFTNYNFDLHVSSFNAQPRGWVYWLGFDYGFTHPTAVVLLAEGADRHTYVVDCYARSKRQPVDHIRAIGQMLQRHSLAFEDMETIEAGNDCFTTESDGKSVAKAYAAHGVKLRPANDDRIQGAAHLLSLLGDAGEGISPRITFHPRTAPLFEQLETLQHDPHRPEDVLKVDVDDEGVGGDDLYDALRYGLMRRRGGVGTARLPGR